MKLSEAVLNKKVLHLNEVQKKIKDHLVWLKDPTQGAKADFSNCFISDITFGQLIGFDETLDLSYADFSNAVLMGVDLEATKMAHSNFSNAMLMDVNFFGSQLNFVNFTRAKLTAVDMTATVQYRTIAENADIFELVLTEAKILFPRIAGANIRSVILDNTKVLGVKARCQVL